MITAPNGEQIAVVVPWHNEQQIAKFLSQWNESDKEQSDYLILQHDEHKEGCAKTKNKGISRALALGADIVVVLDDDCFPYVSPNATLPGLATHHFNALQPQDVMMFHPISDPITRGTPFQQQSCNIKFPVAASIGFAFGNPDLSAVAELSALKGFKTYNVAAFGRYFAMSGMNIAFRPKEWLPWCQFIDVPRYDDIWMGLLWEKEAYRRGFCFNLNGPKISHVRQSNVFSNLRQEAMFAEENETLWQKIHASPETSYEELRKLLPC